MSMQRQTEIMENVSSTTGGAIITTDCPTDYIVRGRSISCNAIIEIDRGTIANFLLDMTNVPVTDGVIVLPISFQSKSSDVRLKIYEDTDYTGSTSFSCINNNRLSTFAPDFTINRNVTGSYKGVLLKERIAFAATQGNVTTSGGSIAGKLLILDTTKKYLLELENTGTADTIVEYNLNIFQG